MLLPYDRGDLVSRVHERRRGAQTEEHLAEGTQLTARVRPALAGELAGYAI